MNTHRPWLTILFLAASVAACGVVGWLSYPVVLQAILERAAVEVRASGLEELMAHRAATAGGFMTVAPAVFVWWSRYGYRMKSLWRLGILSSATVLLVHLIGIASMAGRLGSAAAAHSTLPLAMNDVVLPLSAVPVHYLSLLSAAVILGFAGAQAGLAWSTRRTGKGSANELR